MPPRPLKDQHLWILDHLRDEALGGYGWRRRGTRGWRLLEEVEAALGVPVPEMLPALHRAGLVDRTRVEDPGRLSPLYLYRISLGGMRRLHQEEADEQPPELMEPLPEPQDPEAGTLFIPRIEWGVLTTLRHYALERIGPKRWGEHGWLTALELARVENRAIGEILSWLRVRDLVERRKSTHGQGSVRPLWMYRASATGLQAEMVDSVPVLYEPPARVQVRVRAPHLRANQDE